MLLFEIIQRTISNSHDYHALAGKKTYNHLLLNESYFPSWFYLNHSRKLYLHDRSHMLCFKKVHFHIEKTACPLKIIF